MPDQSHFLDQAARFDRIADQCAIPDLAPYYRELAEDYRRRAAAETTSASPPEAAE